METNAVSDRRSTLLLLTVFSGFALLLAGMGIYGVIAFSTARRTHEIGIRVALGAQRGDVLRLILGECARLAFLGVGIGVVAALALTRLMSTMLYGVSANDPLTFIGVAAVLIAVALRCVLAAGAARDARGPDDRAALRITSYSREHHPPLARCICRRSAHGAWCLAQSIPHAVESGTPRCFKTRNRRVTMDAIWQDIVYGFRSLLRRPGITAIALLTLALGVGANTAIFSVVDTVLLQPLAYKDPGRIVFIAETTQQVPDMSIAMANFDDWKSANHVFEAMAPYQSASVILTGEWRS